MLMMQFERCLMTRKNGANAFGSWSGRPSEGRRAWRWTTAAPASAAPIAASAISSGVIGRGGGIDGGWVAPLTAQGMMTFRGFALGLRALSRLQFPGARAFAP